MQRLGRGGADEERPTLGLYAQVKPTSDKLFGDQTRMFQDLTLYGKDRDVEVVVLTPGFPRSGMTQGWVYESVRSGWKKKNVPLPRVVLRRCGPIQSQHRQKAYDDLAWLRRLGRLHTLPFSCSNKWNLFRTLHQFSSVAPHLPASSLARSAGDVYRAVSRRSDVYVKPLTGSRGDSVYRLLRDGYHIVAKWQEKRRKDDTGNTAKSGQPSVMEQTLMGLEEFRPFWSRTNLHRCLVQDTVPLLRTCDERPFDLRWLVQMSDEPQIVARVARVAEPMSVTTNMHTGGRAMTAQEAFSAAGVEHVDELENRLDEVSLAVARALHQAFGSYAEVGIDLAVTEDERVYVLEANPTPGRRMLRSLPSSVRKMSLVYLIEYAMKATRGVRS